MNKCEKILNICVLLVLVSFGMWSLLAFGRIISNTYDKFGAVDFHPYWYSGHFLRQGKDPYQAFLTNQEPTLPVEYLDGKIASTLPVAQTGLEKTPTNTPPMIIILALFSFVSWPTAKILWMICNLIFMIMIPWMTIRLWPDTTIYKVGRRNLFLALSFWALLATRNTVGNGQTSLFILTLMLFTLLAVDKNWVVAGLALGVALSKYTLSLPILLFLLFKQEYRVVAISLATQIIGLITLSLLTSTTILQVYDEYILIVKGLITTQGVHLASIMQNPSSLTIPISLIFTLIVWGVTGYWAQVYYRRLSAPEKRFSELHILTILILWALLAVYHREYDAVVYIVFVSLVLYGIRSNRWHLSEQQKNGLLLLLVLSLLWMSRPGSITLIFLPAQLAQLWLQASEAIVTIILTLSLVLTIVLLFRIPYASKSSSTQPGVASSFP